MWFRRKKKLPLTVEINKKYKLNNEDPFKKAPIIVTVLEPQGGYVKYNANWGHDSCTVVDFLGMYTKLNEGR